MVARYRGRNEPPGLHHRRNQVLGATTYDMEDCGVNTHLKSKEDEAEEGRRMVGRSRQGAIPVDGDVTRGAGIQLMGIGVSEQKKRRRDNADLQGSGRGRPGQRSRTMPRLWQTRATIFLVALVVLSCFLVVL